RAKKIYVENKVPEKNILVIENGIDLDKFNKKFDKKKIRSEFFLRDEDFLIGMVGRLMESKNQILLIEILSKLKNSFEYTDLRKELKKKGFKNIKLILVGDGPNRKNLENRIKELQLEKEVILTGSRKDIPELMSIMNIFAFPSLFPEGWPNVIGEAMASKLPIIAYDKGDIKEILTNNFDALITETNPEIFEKKLVELILNEKLRKKLSENALKSVQRFSLKNMIKKYEDVYLNYENYVK
ncbi:MAG: glycosyltransferase, partial [Candidatus Woesearchaeota archaeon]